ncbi:hypothetical protein COCSUDRAFT_53378 [Coccomyxa subellipsoidea C-169]|uniref:Uncharacterized protein n=1 Tax=Coccomyxa subellipsoidea (strain C-169) TaxID=574566 RepID=I0YYS1_COCSC|nr:hypothetical protein COCSUDRAFT_53378 [Coccomyxa subellipsoidea C-169]EIE23540.1 hypothetical protein COCSUDRAFT_53378 [Coccomyxa subellipsoidea C-169]|eukprot:XP_005648084.1 hypothetical protein COCSUDRAFT_53378 [Coccomyxa subellipsoidea C-169]
MNTRKYASQHADKYQLPKRTARLLVDVCRSKSATSQGQDMDANHRPNRLCVLRAHLDWQVFKELQSGENCRRLD